MQIPSSPRAMANPYQHKMAELLEIAYQTPDTTQYTFRYLTPEDQEEFQFKPGQYMLLSLFGYGEAPFGLCSSPNQTDTFQFTIRNVGLLTNALSKLSKQSRVGLRGPFGNGWPMDKLVGKNALIVAGGIGLVPLRPVILEILENRRKYGNLQILYGSRCPEELLYLKDLEDWKNRKDVEYVATVDRDDEHCWAGNIGVVTTLFDRVKISPDDTFAFICGPPIMYRFVIRDLQRLGIPNERIFLSLERRMKCGVGHCSHCLVGTKFVCQDGPVFSYAEAKDLRGAV